MLKVEYSSYIAGCVSDFISKARYEHVIEDLMNDSQIIFKSQYRHIDNQPNGEPDFIDINNGEKYDAKLFLTEKQGKDLGARNKNVQDYAECIVKINNEMCEYLQHPDSIAIENTTLYKRLIWLINRIKEDENLIVLFPYAFMNKYSTSILDNFTSDYLDVVYRYIKGYFVNRKLFFIYLTMDNYIALRQMGNNATEYLKNDDFLKYFRIDYMA
ncbi:MAG: hypothetical protein K5923_03215 [Clostridia bacterium]|nr:hypothetical protein [Clostridia bacterium]